MYKRMWIVVETALPLEKRVLCRLTLLGREAGSRRDTCPPARSDSGIKYERNARSIFGMPVYGDGDLCTLHTRSVARDPPHPAPANCMSAQYGLRCLVMGSSALAGAGPTARTVRLPGSISVCLFTARSVSRRRPRPPRAHSALRPASRMRQQLSPAAMQRLSSSSSSATVGHLTVIFIWPTAPARPVGLCLSCRDPRRRDLDRSATSRAPRWGRAATRAGTRRGWRA